MTTLIRPATQPESHAREDSQSGLYFQDGVGLTFSLTLILYLILAISLNAAGWTTLSTNLLIPAVLGGLVLGFFMSMSRFDGVFMVSYGLLISLAWNVYLSADLVQPGQIRQFLDMGIPDLQARSYFVLLSWIDWIEAAWVGSASNDNLIFVYHLGLLIWWLAYLGAWSIFRHGFVWRAVIPAGVAILINTYYAPEPVAAVMFFFTMTALILLVRANLAEQQLRWRLTEVRYSTDITFDFLRDGVIFSLLVVGLAWGIPSLGRNTQLRQLLTPINQRWEESTEQWNRLYQGLNRQTRPTGGGFGRSLTLGGARNVTDAPVFQAQTPVGRYWRAVVFDTFTGSQWINTVQDEQSYVADQIVPTANWEFRRPITQTITPLRPMGNVLVAAPDLRQASIGFSALAQPISVDPNNTDPSPSSIDPGALDGESGQGLNPNQPVEFTLVQADRSLEPESSYTVISDYTEVTRWALSNAQGPFPADITERYLQLPENFSPRVIELAQEVTAGLSTQYEKSRAIEAFLREFEYDEQIEAPAQGQDPIEYFLFDVQRGYCDYYATSMATMLRSLGIPARTASGYAEGEYDKETGIYIVTERDAHTWVEVYFNGLGWVEFEPTAGESALNRLAGGPPGEEADQNRNGDSGNFTDTDPSLLDPGSEMDPFLEDLPPIGDFADEQNRTVWPWWLWTLITVTGLGGVLWLFLRIRSSDPLHLQQEAPAILYARLQSWAERLKLPLRITDTPYEHSAYLGRALPEGRPFIQRIVDDYVTHRFASAQIRERDGGWSQSEAQEENWRKLRPHLWQAWGRRLLRLPPAGQPSQPPPTTKI